MQGKASNSWKSAKFPGIAELSVLLGRSICGAREAYAKHRRTSGVS